MNRQYLTRRKTSSPKGWYRTLLRSYLYRPPVWVYIAELAAVIVMMLIIIFGDSEHAISLLAQVLWGQI